MPAEDTVFQLCVDGPAKGRLFERPTSEERVQLPWSMTAQHIIAYYPHQLSLFGRGLWILSTRANGPLNVDLLTLLSDDAKRALVPVAFITQQPEPFRRELSRGINEEGWASHDNYYRDR